MTQIHEVLFAYAGFQSGLLLLVANSPDKFSNLTVGLCLLGISIPSTLLLAFATGAPKAGERADVRQVCGIAVIPSLLGGVFSVSVLFYKLSFAFSLAFPITVTLVFCTLWNLFYPRTESDNKPSNLIRALKYIILKPISIILRLIRYIKRRRT